MSDFIFFHSCHFDHWVYYELTMACSPVGLISSMDRALCPSSQRLGFYSRSSMNFFRFFCNRLGFSLYCNDHVQFQIFIPSLECDSFQFLVCLELLFVLTVH